MNTTSALATTLLLLSLAACAAHRGATFATPEEAVQRFAAASDDPVAAEELLGDGGFSVLRSGDDVADKADVAAVRAMIEQKLVFEDVASDRKIAVLGDDAFELPIPLVLEDGRWRFDVEAGREEIINRRVGRNEISTIATLRALVEAQHEYVAVEHDGQKVAFAERLLSSPDKHDGLYWPMIDGDVESPVGPLVAEAAREGYTKGDHGPVPYHGYFYRLLTEQGALAPGGALSYRDAEGRLTRGFAVLAWPATYGDSGVMSFLVNHQGIVFQRDLGDDTESIATSMAAYNPTMDWLPAVD